MDNERTPEHSAAYDGCMAALSKLIALALKAAVITITVVIVARLMGVPL